MRTTKGAILCGGRGQGLRPSSDSLQKTMTLAGPKKLPLMAYAFNSLLEAGVRSIILLAGYRSADVRGHFGAGRKSGADVVYSLDARGSKGGASALANAIESGKVGPCDELLVWYGDVVTDLDVKGLLRAHRKASADATLVVVKGYGLSVGVAEVTPSGMVTRVREKPKLDIDVSMGCAVLGPKAIELATGHEAARNDEALSWLVPRILKKGGKVVPYFNRREWFDVNAVSDLDALNSHLEKL